MNASAESADAVRPAGAAAPQRAPGPRSGLTLVDVVVALGVLVVTMLGIVSMARMSTRALETAKEAEVARLAASRVHALCALVRIRPSDAADTGEWLFRGGYEIARAANGSAFLMPDCRTSATGVEDGVSGAVKVEFPVPPLAPLAGRTHAGRLVLYVSEPAEPQPLPAPAFPMTPTLGMTRLDLDGDGALNTSDIRAKHGATPYPVRLVPAKVVVEWRSSQGSDERVEEWFLLGYSGHD